VDVDFRGAVSHHDVVGCMRDSDVLVHTSVREGSPRVIAEAFAAGLPVATVRWPGAQWFSGLRDERALTVSAAPRALAAEFSQMTRSTARRQMRNRAARARRWASLHFSVDSHVARTLAFVGDLRVDTSRRSRRQILEGHLDTA
jgi:glycosyltransferase involved in cell wall biosynthesis